MSLGIIIKAPEGLVLAAESRVTLSTPTGNGNEMLHVNFDNATKVLSFSEPYDRFGVVTYGQAALGFRTAQSFVPEFEAHLQGLPNQGLTVLQFATELSNFFLSQWNAVMPPNYQGASMTLNVAGFDDGEPYGKVYSFDIPRAPVPNEQSPAVNNQQQFGITWGGQREIMDRLMLGYDSRLLQILLQSGIPQVQVNQLQANLIPLSLQLPIQFMPIQDCINAAILFIRTTIEAQKLSIGLRGCGGPIDVAIITRGNPLKFIQQKNIVGEN